MSSEPKKKLNPLDNINPIENPPEYEVNLEELINRGRTIQHNWVRRGIKVSCEGAGHPHHSHFLTQKR